MLLGLFSDLSFWSALTGFVGMLVVKGYEWHLGHAVKQTERQVQNAVDLEASEQDKNKKKLEGAKKISNAKSQKEVFLSKVADRVLLILIISFGLSLGGMVMSDEDDNELVSRVENIELYLWPPDGPGGGTGTPLSEQIDSFKDSISSIQSMQTEIIDTIYRQVQSPSAELLEKVEGLNQEIRALKKKIEVLQRQQGGHQTTTM